ncbi:hydrolase [Asanoa siamensis]|uniref:Hydrolase n=1 Tax=Asanoa siamensis TaxID=926357 RepID=A0ABQ4CP19_9ACTN|nr:hydrolase [Asanoa siamensis]
MQGCADVGTGFGSVGERLLQVAYGSEERAQRFYETQMLDRLNPTMREFIARQEMMFVATADGEGNCDATFRAGPTGFVAVLNDRQVAWLEYRGNGVLASLGNIFTNPHAALLFVDFQDSIGLHVNGRAAIVENDDLPLPGPSPQRWVRVDVDEAYIHCRKHIPHLVKAEPAAVRPRGGDYFHVAQEPTPAVEAAPPARRRWWHRRSAVAHDAP